MFCPFYKYTINDTFHGTYHFSSWGKSVMTHNYNNKKGISYKFIILGSFQTYYCQVNVFMLEDASFWRYHFQHLLGKCNSSNNFATTHDVIMSLSKPQILAILHTSTSTGSTRHATSMPYCRCTSKGSTFACHGLYFYFIKS